MTRREAATRVGIGLFLIALLYAAPQIAGRATADARLATCLRNSAGPADVTVRLGFIPGPTEIEMLSRYGRYGGGGNDVRNVVLLGVPKRNQELLSQLYWIDEVTGLPPCS